MRAAALDLATDARRMHAEAHAATINSALAGASAHTQVTLRRAAAQATFNLMLGASKGIGSFDPDGTHVDRLRRLKDDDDAIVREAAKDCWDLLRLDSESEGSSLDPENNPSDDEKLGLCVPGWRDDDEYRAGAQTVAR